MKARCQQCSRLHEFHNYRGTELTTTKCECGGKLERICFKEFHESGVTVYRNSKNKLFARNNEKWEEISLGERGK